MTRGTLIEELRKLSGMSEAEFAGMHRKAHHIPSKAEQPVSPVPVRMYADDLLIALASRLGVTVEKLVSDDFVKERLSQSPDMEQVRGLKEELENAQSKYSEAPETVRKAIRFREEFPFLRQPDCPDELKVLVADMFSAYDLYQESHRMLVETPDDVATGRLTFGLKRPWRTSWRTAKCGKSWSIIRITEKSSERRRSCGRPGRNRKSPP